MDIGLSEKYWKKPIVKDQAHIDAENRRLANQAKCEHAVWSTRCAICGCIMASDATSETQIKTHEHLL